MEQWFWGVPFVITKFCVLQLWVSVSAYRNTTAVDQALPGHYASHSLGENFTASTGNYARNIRCLKSDFKNIRTIVRVLVGRTYSHQRPPWKRISNSESSTSLLTNHREIQNAHFILPASLLHPSHCKSTSGQSWLHLFLVFVLWSANHCENDWSYFAPQPRAKSQIQRQDQFKDETHGWNRKYFEQHECQSRPAQVA